MNRDVVRFTTLAVCVAPFAGTASAADLIDPVSTGVQVSTPSVALLVLSVALIAALLIRPAMQPAKRWISSRLSKRRIAAGLRGSNAPYLSDFILPGACGGLVRIDHAVLAGGGIACIVHKRYEGTVFGTTDDAQWTCVTGSKRHRFMNPLENSKLRVDAIQKALPGVPVRAIIVFDEGTRFPNQRPNGVITGGELTATIDACRFPACDIDDWDSVWLSLRAAAMTDTDSRKDLEAQLSFG